MWKSPNEYVKIKVDAIKDGKLPIQIIVGKPGFAQFFERVGKGVSGFIGGLLGRGKDDAAGKQAPDALGMRAAGLPRSVHRNAKEHEPDTTRMAGLEEAYALGLAPIPSVGAAPADLCSSISRIRRIPSPLKERFNEEAAARGLPATGIPCLSNGEVLAHKLAYERLGAGDAEGAKEAFTWEGLAALKAERAALSEQR
ncbi:MAG: hypothetical protein HY925_16825 [Elusimicrobia bacterium]|nr:hypothetical protein [Elusimicrobiota bacterium]